MFRACGHDGDPYAAGSKRPSSVTADFVRIVYIGLQQICTFIHLYKRRIYVHPVYMAKMAGKPPPKKVVPRPKRPQYRRTFIRAWREHRDLTLEQLAEDIGTTHATLSRIERGLQPYSQPILEAMADELTGGDVASLLMRNPTDPEGIWSIWDQAKPGQKAQIVEVAKTLLKTGT